MTSPNLILLHAPSIYDFREKDILRGPVNDLVPSSSVFEMYPIGYTTIANFLEDRGFSVRIINLATRMLNDSDFDVERHIKKLTSPDLFGIDLHWLPHAQGALEIARIVKKHHPHTPVVFGGFSSTYFHRELIDYPQVDLVMRGDSTEEAILRLLECLINHTSLDQIPNLTWRDSQGEVQINEMAFSPPDLDYINLDFRRFMVAAVRNRDLSSYLPFTNWLTYPIMPALTCRGCTMNCVGCGGSAFSFQRMHGRTKPVYRSPEKLANDIKVISSVSNGPIFIIGDIRQAGEDYTRRFLESARGINAPIMMELFWPASSDFLAKIADVFPGFALEISVESHDPVVRKAFGKAYQNERLENTIQSALDLGVSRLDIFFMIGLPEQTYTSVLETADYAETLVRRYQAGPQFRPFIGPMAPFVDPGSLAFEHPDKYGYRIFYRTLEEHRQALLEPSWQFTLNYETRWMTRHEIVQATYDAGLRFSEIKSTYGLIGETESAKVARALREGRSLAAEIEQLRASADYEKIHRLRSRINAVNDVRVLEQNSELEIPVNLIQFKYVSLFVLLLREWLKDKINRFIPRNEEPYMRKRRLSS